MVESSQIVVLLILLNASAAFAGTTAVAEDLGVQFALGADEEIEAANQSAKQQDITQQSEDELIGTILGTVGGPIRAIFSLVFAAPIMFINLGANQALVGVLSAPLYVVVGLNIIQLLTGRDTT
jgi:hypothetical protein